MKKFKLFVISALLLCSLSACKKQEDSTQAVEVFEAVVLEVSANSILVEPVTGSPELNSSDQFNIPGEDGMELYVGDKVEIEYNGEILETYPAQLGEVYKITLLE